LTIFPSIIGNFKSRTEHIYVPVLPGSSYVFPCRRRRRRRRRRRERRRRRREGEGEGGEGERRRNKHAQFVLSIYSLEHGQTHTPTHTSEKGIILS
jgi:hypothetical protein